MPVRPRALTPSGVVHGMPDSAQATWTGSRAGVDPGQHGDVARLDAGVLPPGDDLDGQGGQGVAGGGPDGHRTRRRPAGPGPPHPRRPGPRAMRMVLSRRRWL